MALVELALPLMAPLSNIAIDSYAVTTVPDGQVTVKSNEWTRVSNSRGDFFYSNVSFSPFEVSYSAHTFDLVMFVIVIQ